MEACRHYNVNLAPNTTDSRRPVLQSLTWHLDRLTSCQLPMFHGRVYACCCVTSLRYIFKGTNLYLVLVSRLVLYCRILLCLEMMKLLFRWTYILLEREHKVNLSKFTFSSVSTRVTQVQVYVMSFRLGSFLITTPFLRSNSESFMCYMCIRRI